MTIQLGWRCVCGSPKDRVGPCYCLLDLISQTTFDENNFVTRDIFFAVFVSAGYVVCVCVCFCWLWFVNCGHNDLDVLLTRATVAVEYIANEGDSVFWQCTGHRSLWGGRSARSRIGPQGRSTLQKSYREGKALPTGVLRCFVDSENHRIFFSTKLLFYKMGVTPLTIDLVKMLAGS